MSQLMYILAVFIIAGLCPTSTAQGVLKCWRCSSDVSKGEFCNDPFNPNSMSDQQRFWSYVNCSYPTSVQSPNTRPVCKKLVQEVYDKHVISRSCFYEDISNPADKCGRDSNSPYVKTIFCETCNTDGCNSVANITPYLPLILIITTIIMMFNK